MSNALYGYFRIDVVQDKKVVSMPIKQVAFQQAMDVSLRAPIFGVYLPGDLLGADIKRSMLDLKVVGIIVSSRPRESQVIVRAALGHEAAFRVGDTMPGGAVIKRITADGILVLRNGTLESLSLPKNDLIFEAPAKPLI